MEEDCREQSNDLPCRNMSGWLLAGDRIHTLHSRALDNYFILTLNVDGGFSNPLMSAEPSEQNPIAYVTFTFEIKCNADCEFYFIEQTGNDDNEIIVASWNRTVPKQTYIHPVGSSTARKYFFIFVRGILSNSKMNDTYMNDEAAIYFLNVTNVKNGGARDDQIPSSNLHAK